MPTDDSIETPCDPKPIVELMSGSALGAIIQKAQLLSSIEAQLLTILADDLCDYCTVLNIHQGRLKLVVNSSAVATQIRYQEEDLLNQLRRQDILSIECIVRPLR
ncbi:MAG: DUF721 domain-containing protein [Rhodospirillaceae bacterium]|jgi:hypothetical protein|nr:DUF721 domain-containing protein [Rhodospirillaceae bacterium]